MPYGFDLVEFVEHRLQQILLRLRALMPVRDRHFFAGQINRIHFGSRCGWVVDLDGGRRNCRGRDGRLGRFSGLGRVRRFRCGSRLRRGSGCGRRLAVGVRCRRGARDDQNGEQQHCEQN